MGMFPYPKEQSTMNLLQIPAHLQAVHPLECDRKHLAVSQPIIEEMRSAVIRTIRERGTHIPFSVAMLVDSALLQPLLQQHWQTFGIEADDVSAKAVVLYLPKLLAGIAQSCASSQPAVLNADQMDLRGRATYLGWVAHLQGDAEPTVVRLSESAMSSVLSEAYRFITHEWGWMPVVVVSGEVVSVGGFLVDEPFMKHLRDASKAAHCCVPDFEHSKEALQSASRRADVIGMEPWVTTRWYESGKWTVQPEVFAYSTE